MENLIDIHKTNGEIFNKELIEPDGFRSFACKMFDVMTDGKDNCENCIGENFNQLIQTIRDDFFANYTPSQQTRTDFYFTTYILWLYLLVERIDFIFDVINKDNKNKLFSDFQFKNFVTARLIKKWANFIKHPKEFIFSHWPQYIMEGPEIMNGKETVIIDAAFVEKHYTKSDTRIKELENCDSVIVLVPDLAKLTSSFCIELNSFFNFICDNKIVSEYLKSKSTLQYYYDEIVETAVAKDETDGIVKTVADTTSN